MITVAPRNYLFIIKLFIHCFICFHRLQILKAGGKTYLSCCCEGEGEHF